MIDQISFVYVYHQNTLLTMFMDRDDHRLIGLSPLPKKTPWILFEFICSYVVKQKWPQSCCELVLKDLL